MLYHSTHSTLLQAWYTTPAIMHQWSHDTAEPHLLPTDQHHGVQRIHIVSWRGVALQQVLDAFVHQALRCCAAGEEQPNKPHEPCQGAAAAGAIVVVGGVAAGALQLVQLQVGEQTFIFNTDRSPNFQHAERGCTNPAAKGYLKPHHTKMYGTHQPSQLTTYCANTAHLSYFRPRTTVWQCNTCQSTIAIQIQISE